MDLKERRDIIQRHPWEISRAKLMLFLIKRHIPAAQNLQFADIGAGDGYFSQLLQKNKVTSLPIICVDSAYSPLAESNSHQFHSIEQIPDNSLHVILLMDVLEHVEDDFNFLQKLEKKLLPGGKILITVPAHPFLFSNHDKFLGHFRRYKKKELERLAENKNFFSHKAFYFFTSLFIARCLQKYFCQELPVEKQVGVGAWKYSVRQFSTRLVTFILTMDFYWNYLWRKFSIWPGLSLALVLTKKTSPLLES